MAAFSDFLENLIAIRTLKNSGTVGGASYDVGIFTAALNDAGSGTEAVDAVTPYARQAVLAADWTVDVTAGVTTAFNANKITFPIAGVGYVAPIEGFGIYVGANLYYHGAVSPGVAIAINDTFEFAVGALVITFE